MVSDLVEITVPDISPYRKGPTFDNSDVEYIHQFDSGIEGPHIAITAIVHGNEICGAIAITHLLENKIRPIRGKLTLIFANVEAYKNFNERSPYESRFLDEDFNRLWHDDVLNGKLINQEIFRAKEILPYIEQVDCLLDLHSMGDICPPLAMCGKMEKGRTLAQQLYAPEFIISDQGHAAGTRLRDYSPFLDAESTRNALLIECGHHWQQDTADFAVEICYRFLHHFQLIEEKLCFPYLSPYEEKQKTLTVSHVITVENDIFFFQNSVESMQVIPEEGTLLGLDGDKPIHTPYDNCYLIMPQQGARRGQTAVRLAKEDFPA